MDGWERGEGAPAGFPTSAEISRRIGVLAREFFVPEDLDSTLYRIAASAAELIGAADGIGILLSVDREQFRSTAATSPLAAQLEAMQIKLGEGPCLDAARSDPIVRCADLRSETRWPAYASAAVDAGVLSCLSVRLYTHRDEVGTLNLHSRVADAFDAEDEALVDALAAQAATAITAARVQEQLTSALASRDVIGQAKGIIMERYGIDALRAFDMLRRLSQDTNTPLSELATRLVDSGPATA